MSATFKNNAEGGTAGQTVTQFNTGGVGGHTFTSVLVGTDASLKFCPNPARGNSCYEFKTGATAARSRVGWRSFPGEATKIYLRLAVYVPSSMSGTALRFVELLDGTQGVVMLEISATGKINVRHGFGIMATTTSSIKYNAWFRLELAATLNAINGQTSLSFFPEIDSPYPLERLVSTAIFNTRPNGSGVQSGNFGIVSGNYANATIYLDDFTMSTDPISGPVDQVEVLPIILNADAEVGSSGITVTGLNSGNATNDFFDDIYSPAGSSMQYTNEQKAHGTLSYKLQPVNSDQSYLGWYTLGSKVVASRCYVYFTSLPSASTEITAFVTLQPSYLVVGRWVLTNTGKLALFDRNNGVMWTGSSMISSNTWYRLELWMSTGATGSTGSVQAAYYLLDSTTSIESFSTTSAALGTELFSVFCFGKMSSTSYADPIYFDDIMVKQEATGFIGPYTGPPSVPVAYAGKLPHKDWGIRI